MKFFTYSLAILLALTSCQKKPNKILADKISKDNTFAIVDSMARAIVKKGINAGDGYSQIWARDLNTFIEIASEEIPKEDMRGALLVFFMLQQDNGEIVDGYVLKDQVDWDDDHMYYNKNAPNHIGFKNTVETDQESSLFQSIGKYVRKTGDISILEEVIDGKSVRERINWAIDYLMAERYSEQYGLLFGAMTSDWGDIQPGDCFVCDMNECSHPAIDVYDNAMMIIALNYLIEMSENHPDKDRYVELRDRLKTNTRKHLWDNDRQKFIPHIYLATTPIPEWFNENDIHYHGGTAVAIEAGLLSKEEIATVNNQMLENVRLSGSNSIGLTIYPVYPDEVFGGPYKYQNGGDWTWFGGRMIQQLIANGFVEQAYDEVRPMIERVIKNKGFFEWYYIDGTPSGSGEFRGSAGTLSKSIEMFREWAEKNR